MSTERRYDPKTVEPRWQAVWERERTWEVTNDPDLAKAEQKRAQVATAGSKSRGAKLVKLADKIANLRDIAATPPTGWSVERRAEYYRWSREVVAGLRGVSPALEQAFDQAYESGLARLAG